ncbi:MAG TPA: SLC13 family permease [Planctomycetota bacterium]|nr:SLC13 family permease [Planctomycetota bacterium]
MHPDSPPAAPGQGPRWFQLFLGSCPTWYKATIIGFLALNAALFLVLRGVAPASAGFVVGWMIVAEFIFCLAMALKCYPLLPGGLIALEALVLGLTTPAHLYAETASNLKVILLLVFVVAGVGLLKEWLSAVFTALLLAVRSKIALSLSFVLAGAVLSAFLDALTVIAVMITVCLGFWNAYNAWRSQSGSDDDAELHEFRAFLRNLVMHAAVGTALGGVMTVVGEPQNLMIADSVQRTLAESRPDLAGRWDFLGFILRMAPITMPTLAIGLATTVLIERFRLLGYGARLPERVREVLVAHARELAAKRTATDRLRLWMQGACALLLIGALAFHVAEVGIIGLFLIVLAATFTGVSDEHRIGQRFSEALPFTALLVVFFAVVAVIADQGLFRPIIDRVLAQDAQGQLIGFYLANAALSAISDNVFVATVFMNEAVAAHQATCIDANQLERLAVAINIGTNLPSVATPNGQAAFLFLLTSALAAPIRLGYIEMLVLAFPYAVTLTAASLALVWCCA